jgi:hypothetical protein
MDLGYDSDRDPVGRGPPLNIATAVAPIIKSTDEGAKKMSNAQS